VNNTYTRNVRTDSNKIKNCIFHQIADVIIEMIAEYYYSNFLIKNLELTFR